MKRFVDFLGCIRGVDVVGMKRKREGREKGMEELSVGRGRGEEAEKIVCVDY